MKKVNKQIIEIRNTHCFGGDCTQISITLYQIIHILLEGHLRNCNIGFTGILVIREPTTSWIIISEGTKWVDLRWPSGWIGGSELDNEGLSGACMGDWGWVVPSPDRINLVGMWLGMSWLAPQHLSPGTGGSTLGESLMKRGGGTSMRPMGLLICIPARSLTYATPQYILWTLHEALRKCRRSSLFSEVGMLKTQCDTVYSESKCELSLNAGSH